MDYDNTLILQKLQNKVFDFKKLLSTKESILIEKCRNIKIIVSSKINKIILNKSSNIEILIAETISGIDIENSDNIDFYPQKPFNIKLIYSYKSNINIHISKYYKKKNLPFRVLNENSVINYI